nr:hypothetical protein [Tanacetum cinerariifolium]
MHLVWPLWLDLRVIPTHGKFGHRIVLLVEDKENYLEHHIPVAPVAAPGQQVPPQSLATHELKTMFAQQAEQELLQTVREFHACKQEEGQPVSSYVLKMKSYIDNLERLGQPVSLRLAVSLILVSLSKEYDGFVQNYNMHSMGKTVNELHAMLKLHEQTLPKKDYARALHAIRAGRVQKNQKKKLHKTAKGNQRKGKAKMGNALVPAPSFSPKPKNPPTPKKDNTMKDAIGHQCGEVGHWKRNFSIYLSELLKKRSYLKKLALQGLRGSRNLKPGALSLYVDNGHRAAVEAIGEFHLCLPSGLVLILQNCHYAPSITRGIISVSHLYKDGFVNRFDGNVLSVSKNNLVYFIAIPRDGINEIDLSSSNTNDSSIKKRIEKLQHDGLLNSTDIKSFEKCVSCMSGKMARKPYSHQVERSKDLLGLIHTDVCGPFRTVSRQGASYFITFIDDFSRELTLSSLDVLQGLSFFLQMVFTLILATLDGLDVGLLGDVIGENDCDDNVFIVEEGFKLGIMNI